VSSTAHLTIVGKALGLIPADHPEAWTAFIAVIQLGTLSALLLYFAGDLWVMTVAFFRDVATHGGGKGFSGYSRDSRMVLYMVLGTLPVAIVGYAFENVIEGYLTKSMMFIGYSMVMLALFLWLAEAGAQHVRSLGDITWKDALVIGLAQVVALIPGASRSGTTITAALFLGLRRGAAARFSFLLSIPAVLGGGLLELYKLTELMKAGENVLHFGILNLVVATLVSAVVGYAAISWLLNYLVKYTTLPFVSYRIVLGSVLVALVAGGVISPR
jgi:undecaprenyl-diphosphatase